MFNRLLPFLILAAVSLLSIPTQLILNYFFVSSSFLSPSSTVLSATTPSAATSQTYQVLGFLPYWLLNKSEYINYSNLTQIGYFGIEFDSNAQLKIWEDDGKELGLHRLSQSPLSQVINTSHQTNVAPLLVVKILNNEGIIAATDPANRSQVITQISQLMTQYSFSGINIDFEYIGTPTYETQTRFTAFIRDLNSKLKTRNSTLSIDVYADTATKQPQRLWQLAAVAPYVDHIVIMGYDFFRPSSPNAGPISPLRGAPHLWDDDLTTSLRAFTQLVPPRQLILGLPFYGYEWTTQTSQPGSVALPRTGRLATYARVQQLLVDCTPALDSFGEIIRKLPGDYPTNCLSGFHPDSLSPYLVYQADNQINQIWYEDARSFSYKLQLVKSLDLGGIAIWALGYESPHPELWQTISRELSI